MYSNSKEKKIPGGLSENIDPESFDPYRVAEGVEVELEHTSDKDIAAEITRDHLTEDKDYYRKLKEIEAIKSRKLSRRMDFQGMKISIETDKGELRHWYDPHNKTEGTTKMKYPYGYILRTIGDDDEHVDVYVGPDKDGDKVFIIRQNKAPDFSKYDEEKVMVGFQSAKDAKQAYLMHYNSPKFFDSIRAMDVEDFKQEYVKKAFGESAPPNAMQAPEPGNDPALPMFDPYDMNIPQSVQQQLAGIGSMSDKDLMKLAQEVWGEGYEYRPVSTHQVRAELRGYLQDQIEWLQMNPMAQIMADQSLMPAEGQMPHSSDSLQGSSIGGENSNALLNETTLDGTISQEETQQNSRNSAY